MAQHSNDLNPDHFNYFPLHETIELKNAYFLPWLVIVSGVLCIVKPPQLYIFSFLRQTFYCYILLSAGSWCEESASQHLHLYKQQKPPGIIGESYILQQTPSKILPFCDLIEMSCIFPFSVPSYLNMAYFVIALYSFTIYCIKVLLVRPKPLHMPAQTNTYTVGISKNLNMFGNLNYLFN